jgi:hypothetical protein
MVVGAFPGWRRCIGRPTGVSKLVMRRHALVHAGLGQQSIQPAQRSQLTVRDTTPPEIPVIEDRTEPTYSREGVGVEYQTPAATDTVDDDVTVSCAPPSNTLFEVKTTTVTCTATDDAGNKAERTFDITVVLRYRPTGDPAVTQFPVPARGTRRTRAR